jgi:hypothetical protein
MDRLSFAAVLTFCQIATNSTVNLGGAPLASGLLTLVMKQGLGEATLEHRSSGSVAGLQSGMVLGDMATRNGVIAQVGTYVSSVDFGNGPVSPGVTSGLFLVVRRP